MFESLGRDMRMAHMTQEPKKYVIQSLLQTLGFAVAFTLLILLFRHVLPISIPIISTVPEWSLYVLFSGIIPIAAFFLTIFTPKFRVFSRKNKINLNLPYAVTYMQALSTTLTLYELFRSVYEAKDLYGEVSKECGVIVREVELFGNDIITAIEKAMEMTPSDNFKGLLNDLLLIYRTGGDLHAFFSDKADYYREISKNAMESLMEFLEMIAEIYVTAFVAGPIALIIIIVAQNISGRNVLGNLMPILYIALPLAAMVLIGILLILLPPNNYSIIHKNRDENEFPRSILLNKRRRPNSSFVKKIRFRMDTLKFKYALRHPIITYGSTYVPAIITGIIFAIVGISLWYAGVIEILFPVYTSQVAVCIVIILAILPVSISYEIRNHYVKRYERQLPGLLREISDMRTVGMSLTRAMQMVGDHSKGALATEAKIVSEEVRYGSLLTSSLLRMEERIGLMTVKRAITLLVRASEVTDYIGEILRIATEDQEHYLKMKNKRFNVSFIYLAIIYLSVGIFLFTSYQLNVSFVHSFDALNTAIYTGNSVEQMFIIGIILAFFSGLMAGQLSANTMLSGLKHSIIMLIMNVIVFVFVIGVVT